MALLPTQAAPDPSPGPTPKRMVIFGRSGLQLQLACLNRSLYRVIQKVYVMVFLVLQASDTG